MADEDVLLEYYPHIEFLKKLHLFPGGPVSKRHQLNGINRTQAIALPYLTLQETHDASDETSDTELQMNCENRAEASEESLPDVVNVVPSSDDGPPTQRTRDNKSVMVNTTTMSFRNTARNRFMRGVSFNETTKSKLMRDRNVDEDDEDHMEAASRRRTRSSGYITGGSKESQSTDAGETPDNVFTPGDTGILSPVHSDKGPKFPNTPALQVTQTDQSCVSSSFRDDISEDGESGNDGPNNHDSPMSSFMLSDSVEFEVSEQIIAGVGQSECLVGAQKQTLSSDQMAEVIFESSESLLDENDKLLRKYSKQIEEENILQMIRSGKCLEDMEKYIVCQLPSDIDVCTEPAEDTPVIGDVDGEVIHRLQMAVQCDIYNCSFTSCIQGHHELDALERLLKERTPAPSFYDSEKRILHYLIKHAIFCDHELRCTVPMCQFIQEFCHRYDRLEGDMLLKNLMLSLHVTYYCGCYDNISLVSWNCDVKQLQSGVHCQSPSYTLIARLHLYKDVFLAYDSSMIPAINCVIRKVSSHNSHVEMLRKLNHPHLVKHYWIQLDKQLTKAIICTQFHGDSVSDWLRKTHPKGCDSIPQIKDILSHVLSAVEYLHSVDILYLAWTGSDVVVGFPGGGVIHAKLCDFSHAVLMEQELSEEDEEDIKHQLLPAVVPPEVSLSLEYSDQWGIGCFIYEIALGYKVHHATVHEEPETQRQAATEVPDLRDLGRVDFTVASVIRDCLQLSPESRPSIVQLQQHRLFCLH